MPAPSTDTVLTLSCYHICGAQLQARGLLWKQRRVRHLWPAIVLHTSPHPFLFMAYCTFTSHCPVSYQHRKMMRMLVKLMELCETI